MMILAGDQKLGIYNMVAKSVKLWNLPIYGNKVTCENGN